MFKKLNTTTLIIILVILGGLILFNKFYKSKKEESTFRNEFVKIDSASVSQISIFPKVEQFKEIKLVKNGSAWELQNDKIKTAADSNAVHNLISSFADMKSLSLAGQDKLSWGELQVDDTSGTKIKITAGDKTYTMVVGKFGFNPNSRSGITYIRHADEEAVYAVDGFLSFTVNQGFSTWRNKTFIQGNKDSWTSLTFTYPGDSSFVLSKEATGWMVNGQPADSAKAAQYLSTLSNMPGGGFVDSYTPSSTPIYSLTINGMNQSPISVVAYPADSVQKLILHSSLNKDAYLSEGQSNLAGRIFLGRTHFLNQ